MKKKIINKDWITNQKPEDSRRKIKIISVSCQYTQLINKDQPIEKCNSESRTK